MMTPLVRGMELPPGETERLIALRRYNVLDSPPEPGFDRITTLAARLFKVSVSTISLVDKSRVWFKSRVGWGGDEVNRDESLCSLAILQEELLVIHDARYDGRFSCNPWVEAEPGIRFYAGAPLVTQDGYNLGTLCIIDTQPRDQFNEEERRTLLDLAAMVVDELELRLSMQRIASTDRERTALLEEAQQSRVASEAARAEAEAANRAKDEFLAVVSHELRTPLNPIIGWTQILRRGSLTAQQAHALEIVERNARLQNQLIDDLLDVSRIRQGKFSFRFTVVSLSSVAMSAMEAVRGLAEGGHVAVEAQLRVQGQDVVRADPIRLQQAVWNLLTNAIKFTPPDGCVVLSLACQGNRLVLSVRDTGIGIAPDLLPYVFERFRQGDSTSTRKQNGLGLGLFLVKHIVEAHGGTVSAASDGEDKGATFTVELPLFVAESL